MAIEMKVPPVGESITEVTVGNWYKKEGDIVKTDEVICGLDSDKATFELTAEADGILHIMANEGDVLPIGAVICFIEAQGSTSDVLKTKIVTNELPTSAQSMVSTSQSTFEPGIEPIMNQSLPIVEMKVPTVGESVTEVTIASWNKKEGDRVVLDEVLCELESDKATFELPAEATGILRIIAQSGETLPIGAIICRIEVETPVSVSTSIQPTATGAAALAANRDAGVDYAAHHPSPTAAKILAEKGIDPHEVNGTGIDGRITKEDAIKANMPLFPAEKVASQPTSSKSVESAASVSMNVVEPGERGQRRERMTSLRKTIARRLVAVKNETAMLTTFNEVDMKPIMDLRAKYKDKFKDKHAVGLGFMSFFTKAVCIALREFPGVNAQIDGDTVIYHDYCDVSIAVSTDRGLVVPVIRNAEKMGFSEIETEIIRLAARARDNKLGIDEMSGGTFTITNGGIFGSMLSTPIINAPQSAILGLHNIVERPVVVNGEIVIRPIMYVALSYDHRIIDGKESVGFLVRVKQLLEDPTRILLDV